MESGKVEKRKGEGSGPSLRLPELTCWTEEVEETAKEAEEKGVITEEGRKDAMSRKARQCFEKVSSC